MTLEIVDKIRLLTFCLIFFDLSIISAHTPTSTAFKKMRVLISFWWSLADALGAAITSAEIASIFSFLAFYESLTTFDNPISKTRDLASTFLDPAGSGPIIASGLIGLRTGDVSVLLPSLFFWAIWTAGVDFQFSFLQRSRLEPHCSPIPSECNNFFKSFPQKSPCDSSTVSGFLAKCNMGCFIENLPNLIIYVLSILAGKSTRRIWIHR